MDELTPKKNKTIKTLLSRAAGAGLSVRADGDRLVIRGPKSADAVARLLLAHKAEVMEALSFADWVFRPDAHGRLGWETPDLDEADRWWARADFDDLPEPGEPCPKCGSLEAWWDLLGGQHCQHCDGERLRRSFDLAERAEAVQGVKRPSTVPGRRFNRIN